MSQHLHYSLLIKELIKKGKLTNYKHLQMDLLELSVKKRMRTLLITSLLLPYTLFVYLLSVS